MAPKKAQTAESDFDLGDTDALADDAVDSLRGVLKADEDGLPDLGGDFGSDFPDAGGALGADAGFGGDFGLDDSSSSFGSSSDFGDSFGGGMVAEPGSAMHANLDLIMDIPIDVQIILGSSRMQVNGLMNLTEGAIISLDRKIGEPVELMVNGRLIGRGEITVMENDETRFGIKLIEVNSARKA